MAADRYTYVQIEVGGQPVWAATTHFPVAVGDGVTVFGGLPMANFHSKTLNRDFPVIYFSGRIVVTSGATAGAESTPLLPPGHPALPKAESVALPPNHPSLTGQPTAGAKVDLTGIARAEGGKTVQEINFDRAQLSGQSVTVRGKIVKYNAMVMGKNWLHIRDGSGSADRKDNDLTITTAMPAKLGDTVVVIGRVATNRDFGSGYQYGVIIEDARVKVE
jgi:hypothetical protein